MKIKTLVVGPLAVNCYILYDEEAGVLIDPGEEAEKILGFIDSEGITLTHIINTHGHFDHIGANGRLKEETGALLLVHKADVEYLEHADIAASAFGLTAEPSPEPDRLLDDGDVIEAGTVGLEVIHTPGHSPGGICLLTNHRLFTGDTLFAGSIGRTDLVGGSHETLLKSVRSRLFALGDTVEIFPGHGPASTIGHEKKHNPFFAAAPFSM